MSKHRNPCRGSITCICPYAASCPASFRFPAVTMSIMQELAKIDNQNYLYLIWTFVRGLAYPKQKQQ